MIKDERREFLLTGRDMLLGALTAGTLVACSARRDRDRTRTNFSAICRDSGIRLVLLPCSSTLFDETRDARFSHFIESLPGVDIRPQSILEPVGISSALKGFRRPRNHLDWAKRCPRFSSTPVLFLPAH